MILRRKRLVAVAHNSCNASQCGQFFGSALRIAAGDHDTRRRIQPVSPADKSPRRPVRLRSHAARIHHDHIGGCRILLAKPRRAQPVAHRLAIGTSRSATEMLHVKAWMPYSQSMSLGVFVGYLPQVARKLGIEDSMFTHRLRYNGN